MGVGADDAAKRLDEKNKGVIFKNCATFFDCTNKINNMQINYAKDQDVKYSNNYSKMVILKRWASYCNRKF